MPRHESRYPELRDLDPSRLKGPRSFTPEGVGPQLIGRSLNFCQRICSWLNVSHPYSDWIALLSLGSFPGFVMTRKTIVRLAQLWDKNGLLLLHKEAVEEREQNMRWCAFSTPTRMRSVIAKLVTGEAGMPLKLWWKGPSSHLPSGSDLCDLVVDTSCQKLSLAVSDRKDYNHQIKGHAEKSYL